MSGRWAYHGHVRLEDRLRELVTDGRTFTTGDLVRDFGCSQQTCWNLITKLKAEGVIRQMGTEPRDRGATGRPRIVYGTTTRRTNDAGATLAAVWR